MQLPKSLPLRSLARSGSVRATLRPSNVQRAGRRGYASAQGAADQAKQQIGSDMPWLVGSVVAAVVPTYLILANGKLDNPFSYPLPGSHYHGEHGDEEHDDSEEEKGDGDDAAADEEKPESADETADEKKEGDEESKDEGDNEKEAADEKSEKDTKKKADAESDEPQEVEDDSASKTTKKPDAKGGVIRRVESPNALKQGTGENDDDNDNKVTAVAGKVSKSQQGISNTDTKHSYDMMNSGQSTKVEGAPDTAKISGTVDPSRGKPKD